MEQTVVHRADAIESQAQAHHIVMILGESLYARRVAYVAQDLVREGSLQGGGSFVESGGLLMGEGVEIAAVATGKM